MNRLEGQVAIVTGAAIGVGRFVAKSMAAEGAKVVVADIADMDLVQKDLEGLGGDYLALQVNVRDEAAVEAMTRQTAERFGKIDILVNNAAVVTHFPSHGAPPWPRVRYMEKSFWDSVIDTNLGGTFLCTKHVLPYMEERRSGHIINLHGGGPAKSTTTAYATSKDAIRTFTKHVAEEVREFGIVVVCMSPGAAIATERDTEEARSRMPGPEIIGDRFVLGALAPMELTGQLVQKRSHGMLEADIR